MSKYKNKAGYIGFWRVNAPDGGSGVWNLPQVAAEAAHKEWQDQTIYYNSCDSMSGWSNSGVYSTNGSFYVGGSSYAYIQPIPNENLLYSTLSFDVNIPTNSMAAVLFMCASNGQGPYLKLDNRSGKYTGISYSRGWNQAGGEIVGGPATPANSWFNVRIRMYNSSRIDWLTGGEYRDAQAVIDNGPNIAFWGYGGGAYFDNITVKRGII